MLTRRCAWCSCSLPPQLGDESEPDGVSHGVCPECEARALAGTEPASAPIPYLLHRARTGRPPSGTSGLARIHCDQVTADRFRAMSTRLDMSMMTVMRLAIRALEQAQDETEEHSC
jgi:hypothetical protein